MSAVSYYVDVLLPLALNQTYTYSVPEDLGSNIQVGCRVIVPLGTRKLYTGIVMELHDRKPVGYSIKPIYSLPDVNPILIGPQLNFWKWLASYYMCSAGEVMKAALPSGLKLESETLVTLSDEFETEETLKERELKVLNALLPGKPTSLMDLSKSSGIANVLPVVQELMAKGALQVSEGLRTSFKAKTKSFIRLTETYRNNPELLKTVMDEASRAKKQVEVLMAWLELSSFFREAQPLEVGKKDLLDRSGASAAVLQALCTKNILETYVREIDRLSPSKVEKKELSSLSEKQKEAFSAIKNSFKELPVCLLH